MENRLYHFIGKTEVFATELKKDLGIRLHLVDASQTALQSWLSVFLVEVDSTDIARNGLI